MKTLDIYNLKIPVDNINDDLWLKKNILLSILRLDKIDPVISGNKLFKLYYFIQRAILSKTKIITFGGAYSNHLAATASACKIYGLQNIGIVRGEKPAKLSPTLVFCKEEGMQLEFISRSNYKEKEEPLFKKNIFYKFGDHVLIAEGGCSDEGIKGASVIYRYIPKGYTHLCCSAGTGATVAGLINSADGGEEIFAFSALKNLDLENKISNAISSHNRNYHFINDYTFGGYAKKTEELINFMNIFYQNYSIPLDFVYTGKMMFGVLDLISKDYFKPGSKIMCIHTGGLLGNHSLQPSILKYL